MDDLAAFLAACYDEAEALARDSYYEGQRWLTEEEGVYRWPDDELVHMADRKADARFIAANSPAHRLADIALKRAILNRYKDMHWHAPAIPYSPFPELRVEDVAACRTCVTMKLLGAEFAAKPGYREEWRP